MPYCKSHVVLFLRLLSFRYMACVSINSSECSAFPLDPWSRLCDFFFIYVLVLLELLEVYVWVGPLRVMACRGLRSSVG